MKKIESIIRPHLLEAVGAALERIGISGLTITEVKGLGRQKGRKEPRWLRSAPETGDFHAKLKIEALVSDRLVDAAIDAVLIAAKTGSYGDGKVFVYSIDESDAGYQEVRGEPAA
jgi:nitrogen regulatory protein P-II 1